MLVNDECNRNKRFDYFGDHALIWVELASWFLQPCHVDGEERRKHNRQCYTCNLYLLRFDS